MRRKCSIAQAKASGSFAAAYRSFLERHALDEVGLEQGFAASLRDKDPDLREVSLCRLAGG